MLVAIMQKTAEITQILSFECKKNNLATTVYEN